MSHTIAYLTTVYPKVSHTFIRREIVILSDAVSSGQCRSCSWCHSAQTRESKRSRFQSRETAD